MICEICKKEIKTGQYLVKCSKCNKIYHSSCWVKNLGCTTNNCHGTPTKQFKALDENELSNFTKINTTSSRFNPKGIKINRCPVCKHIVLNGEDYHTCSHCGTVYHQNCWDRSGGCILNCQEKNITPTDQICPYCMMPINTNEESIICPKCNIPHHKDCWNENRGCTTYGCNCTNEDLNQNTTPTIQGLICPYCQGEILPNEKIIYCPKCNIPHHESCWQENGGCTTYGCDGKCESIEQPPVINGNNNNKNQNDNCSSNCMTTAFIIIILFYLLKGCI